MTIEQTKGNLRLRGEIYGLGRKPYENDYVKTLNLTIKTAEGNRVPIKLGRWKDTKLEIKVKCEGVKDAYQVPENEAVDEIMNTFSDGDTVFVICRPEIDVYHGEIDYYLKNIYISDTPIDFEESTFHETNDLSTSAIISAKYNNGIQKVMFANYKGKTIEKELIVTEKPIEEYLSTLNVGDLFNPIIKVVKTPIYEDKPKDNKQEGRTTLMGHTIGGNNSNKKIVGYTDKSIIVDIDTSKTETGKYQPNDLIGEIETLENDDMPF